MKKVAVAVSLLAALSAFAPSARAQSREILGYMGVLGEWELTATVTEMASRRRAKEYAGPFTMRHVGFCAQDGPEERTGEIRFEIVASSSRLNAVLSVSDGAECSYRGSLSDSYTGMLRCPDRQAVPLELWLR